MSPFPSYSGRLLLVTLVLVIAGIGEVARAQDDEEKDEKVEVNQNEQQQRAIDLVRAEAKKEYKDRLVRWITSPSGTRVSVRAQLETQLEGILDKLKADCHPTEAQMKKLRLAAGGDIKRFMDRLDCVVKNVDDTDGELDKLEFVAFEMRKARNAMNAGLFGEDSLFYKTLVKNNLRYPIAIARAVDALQGNLRLKQHQRTELLELLLRETRPPRKYGKASDTALLLFQASTVPADKIRRILDEAQWREMCRWMTTYKQGAGSEDVLKRNGFVFDDLPILTHQKPAGPVAKDDGQSDVERNNRE
jgi:hypothetical protein